MKGEPSIKEIYNSAYETAETLLRKKVDSIVCINKEGDLWIVETEVLERKSVPDTQDILGRYQMEFGSDGELHGYSRVLLRRRSEKEAQREEV